MAAPLTTVFRPFSIAPRTVLVWASSFVLVILLVLPLIVALIGSFGEAGHYGWAGWQALTHAHRALVALGNSVELAILTQAGSMVIAIAIAWILGRTDLPGRQVFEFAFWLSFFMPTLAVVQGWTLLLDPHYGLMNQWLESAFGLSAAPLDIYSKPGIVFAHLATTTISAKVMMLVPAFRALDSRLEEAAVVSGSSRWETVRRVTLPVLRPTLVVTALLGLVYALQSLELELVLGAPRNIEVYSTLIYRMTQSDPIDFRGAFVLGDVIAVITIGFAWFANRTSGHGNQGATSSQATFHPIRLGRARWPLATAIAALCALLTIVPCIFLLMSSVMTRFGFFDLTPVWTLQHWADVLRDPDFLSSLRHTVVFAGGSAALAVALSLLLAQLILHAHWARASLLSVVSWAPSSIPGVLFSLSWLWVILTLLPPWMYGSITSLILVTALAWITLGTQMVRNRLAELSPFWSEAAWVAGASRWATWRTVVLPLYARTLAVVAIMVFKSAIRDVGHIALLSSADNQPLSILQLGFIADGRSEPAAVVGVLLAMLASVAACVVRRTGWHPPTS